MSQGRQRNRPGSGNAHQAPGHDAHERATPGEGRMGSRASPQGGSSQADQHSIGNPDANWGDMDVTVLAFAQWASEMKTRQSSAMQQCGAEMSMIRNAVGSNAGDLGDFKRHGATIQSQMQSEINEIRETLSSVFMEITAAVRNNAAADQDIKLRIQSLNEQAVRNETAFAQLADAADKSQGKLRTAVTEMQLSSERMRDDLGQLARQTENLEAGMGDKMERIGNDMDGLSQDLRSQLERRRDHLKKMVNDVVAIGESLQNLVQDFGEQRRGAGGTQGRIQNALQTIDHAGGSRPLQATADALQPARYVAQGQPQMPYQPQMPAGMYQPAMNGQPMPGQVFYR